jgi:hypothetical protein
VAAVTEEDWELFDALVEERVDLLKRAQRLLDETGAEDPVAVASLAQAAHADGAVLIEAVEAKLRDLRGEAAELRAARLLAAAYRFPSDLDYESIYLDRMG